MHFAEKYVQAGGVRTRYFEAGDGREKMVLFHGGQYGSLYSADSWDLNIEGLSGKFHLYAPDKLGMGYTDNPPDDASYTIDCTVRHAFDFLDAVGIGKAHLVGHSRGAYLVARVALERPGRVETLTMVDSNTAAREDASYPSGRFYEELEKRVPPGPPTAFSVRLEPEAQSFSPSHITEEFVSKMLKIALLPKTLEAREKMRCLKREVFIPNLNKRREELIRRIETEGFRSRTLIVWGADDRSAPLPLAYDFYNTVRMRTEDAQLHVFNHAGHYCFREHPEMFNKIVTDFVGSGGSRFQGGQGEEGIRGSS